jgi:hypothetical protein
MLSRRRVRKLFSEASKRKHPLMTATARKEMLLASDARERKGVALHVLSSLRRASKTQPITDTTDIAMIFTCTERQPEQNRWCAADSTQYQTTSEMSAFEKQYPLAHETGLCRGTWT